MPYFRHRRRDPCPISATASRILAEIGHGSRLNAGHVPVTATGPASRQESEHRPQPGAIRLERYLLGQTEEQPKTLQFGRRRMPLMQSG